MNKLIINIPITCTSLTILCRLSWRLVFIKVQKQDVLRLMF